jgi:5'-nucleotidase/UDP-sugar diphosphatase
MIDSMTLINVGFLFIILSILLCSGASTMETSASTVIRFNILQTSDLHSYFEGVGPDSMLHETRGHFARLKFAITNLQKQLNPYATLTLDAGDWNSGTLFHLIQVSYLYPDLVPELSFLSDCNYDAISLGNHEFDGKEEALSYIILKANRNGIKLPILTGNIQFDEGCILSKHYISECNAVYTPTRATQKILKTNFSSCIHSAADGVFLTPYILKELKSSPTDERSIRVAILGIFSINAAETSAISRKCVHFYGSKTGKNFAELINSIKKRIIEIRTKHNPDVVILLNHSGEPEDENIVYALQKWDENAIDVHISSHTHHCYLKKIKNTVIHQAGPYGVNLGVLQFSYNLFTKKLTLLNEHIPIPEYFHFDSKMTPNMLLPSRIPINSAIPYDSDILQKIELYKKIIDNTFLKQMQFSYNTDLGFLEKKPESIHEVAQMISDALLEELNIELAEKAKRMRHNNTDRPIDLFMFPVSGVRTEFFSLNASRLQFSDIFRAMGVGSLNQNITGHNPPSLRLAHFYLSKRHLRQTIEGSEFAIRFVNEMMGLAYSSNLSYRMRYFGIPLYNLFDIRINGTPLEKVKYDYIHVAAPSYAASFMKLTSKFSKGILSLDFRDRFGRVIKQPFLADHQDYVYISRKLKRAREKAWVV